MRQCKREIKTVENVLFGGLFYKDKEGHKILNEKESLSLYGGTMMRGSTVGKVCRTILQKIEIDRFLNIKVI